TRTTSGTSRRPTRATPWQISGSKVRRGPGSSPSVRSSPPSCRPRNLESSRGRGASCERGASSSVASGRSVGCAALAEGAEPGMRNDLDLDLVSKKFGDLTAVHQVSVTIPQGEFFSFLGPSGCGKTTILRMISGFIDPTDGEIRLAGRTLAGIGPNRRPTALIFQNLALFPLMTVAENIAYGLKVRGAPRAARERKVAQLLDLTALPGYGPKRVDELSGGQKQRVAIARALAVEPAVLLLDEPLSALDLKLRQHMRAELRELQRRTGITFIYITHDQGEALGMPDRVAVMSQGRMEQIGTSTEIYNHPRTAFVASFVGENNRFSGRVVEPRGDLGVMDSGAARRGGR